MKWFISPSFSLFNKKYIKKYLLNSSLVRSNVVHSSLQLTLNLIARSEIFSFISFTLLRVSASRWSPLNSNEMWAEDYIKRACKILWLLCVLTVEFAFEKGTFKESGWFFVKFAFQFLICCLQDVVKFFVHAFNVDFKLLSKNFGNFKFIGKRINN